jgi:hypothetical protein
MKIISGKSDSFIRPSPLSSSRLATIGDRQYVGERLGSQPAGGLLPGALALAALADGPLGAVPVVLAGAPGVALAVVCAKAFEVGGAAAGVGGREARAVGSAFLDDQTDTLPATGFTYVVHANGSVAELVLGAVDVLGAGDVLAHRAPTGQFLANLGRAAVQVGAGVVHTHALVAVLVVGAVDALAGINNPAVIPAIGDVSSVGSVLSVGGVAVVSVSISVARLVVAAGGQNHGQDK